MTRIMVPDSLSQPGSEPKLWDIRLAKQSGRTPSFTLALLHFDFVYYDCDDTTPYTPCPFEFPIVTH